MNRRQTYEQANKIYDKAMKLEQEFGEYFTGKTPLLLSPGHVGLASTSSRRVSKRLRHLAQFLGAFEPQPFQSTHVAFSQPECRLPVLLHFPACQHPNQHLALHVVGAK